jgi:hypothetical protein
MRASSTHHEGGNAFLARAKHFARREMEAHPGELPISFMQLSHYLLFRAGASATEIAAIVEIERRYISKRLMCCMAALGAVDDQRRARVERLVAEFGQINFEPRDGVLVRFPGPAQLAPPRTVEATL